MWSACGLEVGALGDDSAELAREKDIKGLGKPLDMPGAEGSTLPGLLGSCFLKL